MPRLSLIALILATVALPTGAADTLSIPIARDTWVSDYHDDKNDERHGNNGGDTRLKTKGSQELVLLDIDPAQIAQTKRVITHVTLHLHTRGDQPQRRVTVSTLATPWNEGTARGYAPQAGSATFNQAMRGQRDWAYPQGDLTTASLGQGHTIWSFADATGPDAAGWQTIRVEPRVLAARLAGISQGFVVMDDTGSEYQRDGEKFTYHLFPNRWLDSRESGRNTAPYFTVTLGDRDDQPPLAVTDMAFSTQARPCESSRLAGIDRPPLEPLPPSQAIISWLTPRDHGPAGTLGFHVMLTRHRDVKKMDVPRYLIPMAGQPGQPGPSGGRVTLHLRDMDLRPGEAVTLAIAAVDAVGNIGPAATVQGRVSDHAAPQLPPAPAQPFTQQAPLPTFAGLKIAIIDPLDKVQPITGKLIPAHEPGYLAANHLWSAKDRVIRLYAARNEFVAFQLLLEGEANDLQIDLKSPWQNAANLPAGAAGLMRLAYVDTDAGPLPDPLVPVVAAIAVPNKGHRFAAFLADLYVPHDAKPGVHRGSLVLTHDQQRLEIPIELHVWPFTLPDRLSFLPEMNCYGLPSPPLEVAYYRLAHVHRTCLNRLPYNWRGQVHDLAPKWDGQRFDWTDYNKRFGPLVDGSAFADLPRASMPVDVFYLPLNENWPMDIERGFGGGYWPENALTPEYRQQFVSAVRQFALHFAQKNWTRTQAEFYLNGKVYNKRPGWSRASSPWVFDEPVNTQDFWALRWYGQAFKEGADPLSLGERAGVRAPPDDAQPPENTKAPGGRASDGLSPSSPRATPHAPSPGLEDSATLSQGERGLVFRADISRPQWQRDILDEVLDVNVVGGAFRQHRRTVRDRAARHPQLVINYGSANPIAESNVQPAAWCLEAWSLGADGVLPWQTVGNEQSWQKADTLSLFYPPRDEIKHPLPSIRLKAFRRGQQDVEYLTLLMKATRQPRWAVAQALHDAQKLDGRTPGADPDVAQAPRFDGIDPAALWQLRLRVAAMIQQADR
ncbi:MAG: hypothetical protein WD042_13245 [Phycisphaeraceae bacterium]